MEENIVKEIPDIEKKDYKKENIFDKDNWTPKTQLGNLVKKGEIKDIDDILDNGMKILEPEIIDVLMPNIESELLLVGQSKGKFGGGQRRVFKQTQKKTREGNKPHFSTFAVIGNKNGYVGIGTGKSKETVPAREKAFRNAKLNLIKIRRGNGSWEDPNKTSNSIPFKVSGKCGSVKLILMPAPKGTGLKVEKECQKILTLAGIKDVWSTTFGQTKSKSNLIWACEKALRQLMETKVNEKGIENTGLIEGKIKEDVIIVEEANKNE
jgi:small subunit ribosomal protein S5